MIHQHDDNLRRAPRLAQPAALAFALLYPTIGTWLYFVALAGHALAAQPAYVATKLVQFAFPLVWVVWWQRRPIRLAKPTKAGLGWGLSFGLVVFAAILVLYYGFLKHSPLLAEAPCVVDAKTASLGIDSIPKFLALAVFYALVHSLLEEYYWRWFVFGQLKLSLPLLPAIVISSLGFMAHHVVVVSEFLHGYGLATWFFSLCVALGGAAWAWIYHRSGSLYGAWLGHLLVDAALMWLGYDLLTSAG